MIAKRRILERILKEFPGKEIIFLAAFFACLTLAYQLIFLLLRAFHRLAYPGLWWRVTMLALAMCGHSPSKLGAVMWEEHPTLRALITMVTSNRFRFPTVDCDEDARAEVKRLEQAARESVR